MPPKAFGGAGRGRGRSTKGSNAKSAAGNDVEISDPFSSDEEAPGDHTAQVRPARQVEEDENEPEKSIPKDLLTRLLHEFFARDSTRISRDANAAVGKYMEIFLREAIARAAMEKNGGFLEVEDLEKIAPQLLLDL